MRIFHLALLHIARQADVVVRSNDYARPLTREKLPDRLDLFWCCFLFRDHMIQAKHHKRVRVCKNPFVDGQLISGLINPLENRDRL